MIEREYYPISEAARIIDCSIDDLIHLGAIEKIKLYLHGQHKSFRNGVVMFSYHPELKLKSQHEVENYKQSGLIPIMSSLCSGFESIAINNSIEVDSLFVRTLNDNSELWVKPITGDFSIKIARSDLFVLHADLTNLNQKNVSGNRSGSESSHGKIFDWYLSLNEAAEELSLHSSRKISQSNILNYSLSGSGSNL